MFFRFSFSLPPKSISTTDDVCPFWLKWDIYCRAARPSSLKHQEARPMFFSLPLCSKGPTGGGMFFSAPKGYILSRCETFFLSSRSSLSPMSQISFFKYVMEGFYGFFSLSLFEMKLRVWHVLLCLCFKPTSRQLMFVPSSTLNEHIYSCAALLQAPSILQVYHCVQRFRNFTGMRS
jgi:hypothetical protein